MSHLFSHQSVRLIFDPEELNYGFGPQHPFNPTRLKALVDLLEITGLWRSEHEQTRLPSRAATDEELSLVHTPEYIAAVQRLSVPEDPGISPGEHEELAQLAFHYGLGDGDTPASPGMHAVSARVAGGTLVAMSAVMGLPEGGTFAREEERPLHVFHPAGGLHHAWAERASGFCIYNDASIAIAHVLRSSAAKILYIDFDAHHGDGVQRSFYDEPRVMTVSFHETGRYLFPGTGDVLELGNGGGRGYTVNVPLEPFTEDDSYIEAMYAVLSPVVTFFAPDIIVTQHGCDTHAWDPLTHMSLTMRGIRAQIKLAHQLAHTYCNGRWVALGGGGYDLYRMVPRAWSLLWGEMSEQEIPEHLPQEWIERWRPAWVAMQEEEKLAQELTGKSALPSYFPTTFLDRAQDFPPQPRRWSISRANRQTVALLRNLIVPPPVRHAFPAPRQLSAHTDLFDLLHMGAAASHARTKTLETAMGPILFRRFCPPSFVERLRPDSGLHSFARLPEREHQLLLDIAKSPDCALTLAYTPAGEIVGQVTIAPADEWWEDIEDLYEVAVEVSVNWRRATIARTLLSFALELDALEDMIFFAIGLSWHWDAEDLGMSLHDYRALIAHLYGTQGFVEYPLTDPDVSKERTNVPLARIGKRIDTHVTNQFLSRLLSPASFGRF